MGKRAILRKEIRQLRRDLRAADLRSTDLRFQAVERNTDLASGELRGRLELLNELRADVVVRGEFTAKVDALESQFDTRAAVVDKNISDLKDRINTSAGTGLGLNRAWGYLVGVLGLGALGVDLVLRATGH